IIRCSTTLDDIEDLQQQMLNERENLDQSKEVLQVLELDSKNIEHLFLSSEKTIARLSLELNKYSEVLSETLNAIQDTLIAFNIHSISLASLDETQTLLTKRRDQWLENNAQKNHLEQKINQLKLEQKHHHENSQKLEKDLHEQQRLIKQLSQIWDELITQRNALFAHKNPDEEAEKLSSAVEKAEQSVQTSRQAVDKDRQNLLQLKTTFAALDKEILTRDIKLKQQDESFKIRLKQLDFANEEAFKQACLSEQQRNKLIEQETLLSKEQTELAVKIHDNNNKLAHERHKNLSDQELEQLQLDFTELENQLRELQGELGAIEQKLTDNAALREVQQARLVLIDKQNQECHHWDVLHDIIGSADGKKYRNFAQGLTFEMMVGHANQQLQKMTQRYLLVRDEKQPLELNVVDNFQAGEVRSTKNLSGGESFIVSLSLALGLSQMASKNVRVDSLFLDEGFGTLDEEALDNALETLSGLQQEGKLIGVISHVQALKDRISTQILVNPLNGGRSEITGQGCSSISNESVAVAEN
ncbi:MAG: hypothetical protein KAI17_25115, partial [Thiotrichaceae bacterium]|nr:hypothetical protein [Thiotrichaceae bacterium]